jgi:hypothetical protein
MDEGVGQLADGRFPPWLGMNLEIITERTFFGGGEFGGGLTQAGVDKLVASFSKIRECTLVNDAGSCWDVGRTVSLCVRIQALELKGYFLKDAHLTSVALPSLVILKFSNTCFVTDAGVTAIIAAHSRSLNSITT